MAFGGVTAWRVKAGFDAGCPPGSRLALEPPKEAQRGDATPPPRGR